MWKLFAVLAVVLCLREIDSQSVPSVGDIVPSVVNILKGVTVRNRPYAEQKNGRIEGFAADLIKEISEMSGFRYTLEFTPDGKYGSIVNGTMVGMIGEVSSGRADFAVADIAVDDIRKQYVDFTEPFIETSIVILIHKNNVNNIHSFANLADQTNTQYGAVLMGSTYYQLSQSTDPVLSRLYRQMQNKPENLVRSLGEGMERVNSTNFAMIVEKSFAEYITGLNCDLTFIDDTNNYFPRQFAIALNKNDTHYTHIFNSAIKELKASGRLDLLKNRYWKKCGVVSGVTVIQVPYAEFDGDKISGGFVVDLIRGIEDKTGLNLELNLQPDAHYGYVEDGIMNGMLGEVHYKWADFAVADLTITEPRKQFVDFTEPFIESGIAILIHKNYSNTIRSFRDLADQTAIKYGWLAFGATNAFFNESNDSTIKKMNEYVQNHPENYVNRVLSGIERTLKEPYALITERSTMEYITGQECDLTFVSDPNVNDPRNYAIAVQKNSPYLDKFNQAIREMKKSGIIDNLKNRYWKKCGVLSGVTVKGPNMAHYVGDRLEGIAVDLMDEISEVAGFNYSLYFSPDKKYGMIENGKINGMLGDVSNRRADFAVADITITDPRKQFVDFTEPFAETGLVILINKNYSNSITSFADLTAQTAIKYGLIKNGSTHELFKQSSDPTIQAMYRQMISNPEVLVSNGKEGFQKVKTTPYAFVMEKIYADLILGDNCDLTYIEDPAHYYARQFAIALPKNSTVLLGKFNSVIREMKSKGRVEELFNRYKKKCGFLKGVTVRSYEPIAYNSRITGKMTGFAVDLMDEIATIMGKNYTMDFVYDGKYGRVSDDNKTVDGMVGEVYRGLADFAIADLTVTESRKRFIDFTEPFIESDLAILIHKRNANNITSFMDLAQQTDIKFGAIRNGMTMQTILSDKNRPISEIDHKIRANPLWLVSNGREGVERVNSTRYALIGEKLFAEYFVGKNCDDLTLIVDPVLRFERNYAIALPKNSELLSGFNSAINQLKTNGVIDRLKAKYYKTCEQ